MKWLPGEPVPGDMVRVQIGSIFHYGVYVGDDAIIAFGLPPLPRFANEPDRFLVVSTDMDVFCCGRIPEIAVLDRAERKKRIPPEITVANARQRLGEDGYHMIRNNCEHFAYECVFGEKKSLQEEAVFRMWNQRPVLNVYVAEADRFAPDFPVPKEREAEIASCSNDGMRKARIADWALLRLAARHSFSLDPDSLVFTKNKHGGWSCDRFSFSFSHADGLVCIAVSNEPVGVDLETVGGISRRFDAEKLRKLRARCLNTEEQRRYPETVEGFLACWTRKEAIFKQSGKRTFSPEKTDTLKANVITYAAELPGRAILSAAGKQTLAACVYRPDETGFSVLKPEGPLNY